MSLISTPAVLKQASLITGDINHRQNSKPVACVFIQAVMASYKSCIFTLLFVCVKRILSKEYVISELNQCTRVPEEPPCNVSFNHFVPDYASQRYEIMMETIYRKSKDIMRLDSRPQCVNAYKAFLCAQLFPRCSKHQNRNFQNLQMQRWVIHDPDIKMKCWKIFAACNSRVASRFMSSDYFLCDHLPYTSLGWEADRCVPYDLDSRCDDSKPNGTVFYLLVILNNVCMEYCVL